METLRNQIPRIHPRQTRGMEPDGSASASSQDPAPTAQSHTPPHLPQRLPSLPFSPPSPPASAPFSVSLPSPSPASSSVAAAAACLSSATPPAAAASPQSPVPSFGTCDRNEGLA
ncbi:hypothetical protein HPP92_003138 [Vanilla planifolia]|uniref:Uncharacterized protein n=1 Tax=Vanilla planifolia TaxID=51239 RepID=A0A835VNC9_VANPL|nr:hypothetical protein HPP92_027821 [Vanilla planifolia]KAG0503066.1 hypothetical protein HPP92_003138 [Vanilla planifolia]